MKVDKMKNKIIYIKDDVGSTMGLINPDQYNYIRYTGKFAHIKKGHNTILTIYTKNIELVEE